MSSEENPAPESESSLGNGYKRGGGEEAENGCELIVTWIYM
jgi:hypothetical protein